MKADIVVKGIIWNSSMKRLLIVQRNQTDSVGANTWENIGGNIETGENIEEGLRREISEEVGITDITITKEVTLSFEHQSYLWADAEECRRKLPKEILDDFERNGIWELFDKAGE